MRKALMLFVILSLFVLLLAACGKKATPTEVPTVAPPTPTQFKQSLPLQGSEEEPAGLANPTESPLPTPVSPLPTPTPTP